MTSKSARIVAALAILSVLMTLIAFLVRYTQPGIPLWHMYSGRTLTEVQILPDRFWGFGTTPMTMTTATGAPVNGGSTTRYGFVAVTHYDLRVWQYDPKTGTVCYTTN